MLRNNINTIKAMVAAYKFLSTLGNAEFTSKQYNAAMPQRASSLTWLRENGIITVSRKECFDKEVPVSIWRRGQVVTKATNDAGEVVNINYDRYMWYPANVKAAIDAMYNNGKPLHLTETKVGDTEIIHAERYYYRFNEEKFLAKWRKERKHFGRVVERREELAAKAVRRFNEANELMQANLLGV